MSIFRENLFDSLYSIESIEIIDENTDYELVMNEVSVATVIAGYELGEKLIKFVGTVAYNIKRNVDIAKAKEKLNMITRYYESKDEKFISDYELKKKTFSVKRYFEGKVEKQKEIEGVIKKFFFNKFYPDKAYTYYKEDKPIYTYFKCSDIDASAEIKNALFSASSSKIENISSLKKAIPESSLKYTGNKFFFKLEDKKYEKYRYYYLSLACFSAGEMVTEAINWIDKEYNKIQKEKL